MELLCLFLLLALAHALSSSDSSSMAIPNSLPQQPRSTSIATSAGGMSSMTMSAAATSSSPEYSITALPAVMSQPSCVFNCLIPIGLADPSGCDDVSNECACLSAPSDALDVLTNCVQTVCLSSTSAYAATATSLYQSYCQSIYGTGNFSQAFVAESSAVASSSIAAAKSASAPGVTTTVTPSPTAKSLSVVCTPSLLATSLSAIAALLFLTAL